MTFLKLIVSLSVLTSLLLLPKSVVRAEGEFETKYNITYDIDNLGVTLITENITLKNLTDQFYPSNFSLTIGATSIDQVNAFDNQGSLPTTIHNFDKKSKIDVNLVNQQIVGRDKEYSFTLKFITKDFSSQVGKIWQVFIPKIQTTSDKDKYNLTLLVPVAFGDPASIIPEPEKTSEVGGKLKLDFSKDSLSQTGILANFGTDQALDFKLVFNLSNNGFLPKEFLIPLPPDTSYQQVLIKSIDPKPENVILDQDGNYLALFRIGQNKGLTVTVTGNSKLFATPFLEKQFLTQSQLDEYKSNQKFWDKDSIQIKAKSKELLLKPNSETSTEKARLINEFITSYLQFDSSRIRNNNFARLGSLAALNNPDKSLASEFTDLFIALARASDIPARAVVGYAHTNNQDLRPLSFEGTKLHTWPEYYDNDKGWVMIDPTWQSTSGEVDYFSKFDLNHFVTFTRGKYSQDPYPLDSVDVKFSEFPQIESPKIKIDLEVNDEIYSGIPAKAIVKIINLSGSKFNKSNLSVSASKLLISSPDNKLLSFSTPPIPPFGEIEYEFDLRSPYIWESYDDIFSIKVGFENLDKKIIVRPIFAYKFFPQILAIIILSTIAVYFLTLGFHLKNPKGHTLK